MYDRPFDPNSPIGYASQEAYRFQTHVQSEALAGFVSVKNHGPHGRESASENGVYIQLRSYSLNHRQIQRSPHQYFHRQINDELQYQHIRYEQEHNFRRYGDAGPMPIERYAARWYEGIENIPTHNVYQFGIHDGYGFIHIQDTKEYYGFNPFDFKGFVGLLDRMIAHSCRILGPKLNHYDLPGKAYYMQKKDVSYLWRVWLDYAKRTLRNSAYKEFIYLQKRLLRHTGHGYVSMMFWVARQDKYASVDACKYPLAAIDYVNTCHMLPGYSAAVPVDYFKPYYIHSNYTVGPQEKVRRRNAQGMVNPLEYTDYIGRIGLFNNMSKKRKSLAKRFLSDPVKLHLKDRISLNKHFNAGSMSLIVSWAKNGRFNGRLQYMLMFALFHHTSAAFNRNTRGGWESLYRFLDTASNDDIHHCITLYTRAVDNKDVEPFSYYGSLQDYVHYMVDYLKTREVIEDYGRNLIDATLRSIDWHQNFRNQPVRGWVEDAMFGGDVANYATYTESTVLVPIVQDETPVAEPVALEGLLANESIRFLGTVHDIKEEGRLMGHCVSIYARQAYNGQCWLFHVEHEEEMATVMVNAVTRQVTQAYGPNNARNNAAAWAKEYFNNYYLRLNDGTQRTLSGQNNDRPG